MIGVGGADIGSPIIPAGGEGSVGVLGTTRGKSSSGVIAISSGDLNFPSLVAANLTPSPEAQGWAAWFIGNTVATGLKSAAVLHSDGSHRLLYAMESPECWFEDFGEGQLMGGSAEVRLDPDFGALVVADGYHVFITPYGESNGLFVADRNVSGFRVCEQHGGTSNVNFAYRVVAKRKDVVADRLARLTLPQNFPPVSSASP